MSDLDLNAAITYLRAIAESVTVGHYGDALSRVLDATGAVAATEARIREAEDEMARLRALSARWQEVINAPVFMQAVEAEAHAYHETACIYRQRLTEAVATIKDVEALLPKWAETRAYNAEAFTTGGIGMMREIDYDGDLRRILTRHQDKRENGSVER